MSNDMIYLAGPYSSPDSEVRSARAAQLTRIAAEVMAYNGAPVFSPITHGHEIAAQLASINPALAELHAFWLDQCIAILRHAGQLWIAPLEGWRTSKGIAEEVKVARMLNLPIYILQTAHLFLEALDGNELEELNYIPVWELK